MSEKCYQLFLSGIRTEKTKNKYEYYLKKFLKETKLKNFTALIELDDKTRQDILEQYVMMLKNSELKRSTVRPMLYAIELFFDMNKKMLYKKILSKMVDSMPNHIKGGRKAYTNNDVIQMINNSPDLRSKALIHFYASLGIRSNAIHDPILTFNMISQMPLGCLAVHIYSDSNEEYYGFLTPEATKSLYDYRDERIKDREKITIDSPIFRSDYNGIGQAPVKPLTTDNAFQIIDRIVRKSNIERIKTGNRYDKAINTAFRKRFDTILKSVENRDNDLIEKLMGHSITIPLDNIYFTAPKETLFKEFKKSITELTVNDLERNKIKIEKLENEKTELQTTKQENDLLHNKIDEQNKRLKKLENMWIESNYHEVKEFNKSK